MKDTKSALLQNELSMATIARAEGNRDLAFSVLYRAVQILSEGTRFERDAETLCQTVNALWVETRPKEEVVIRQPHVVKWYEDAGHHIAHEKVCSDPAEAQGLVAYLRHREREGLVYHITLKPLPKRSDR